MFGNLFRVLLNVSRQCEQTTAIQTLQQQLQFANMQGDQIGRIFAHWVFLEFSFFYFRTSPNVGLHTYILSNTENLGINFDTKWGGLHLG
jgi:hypothetical protein